MTLVICPNARPDMTPATPAIAEPIKKVREIVRSTLMPSISAASRSEATARIDLPNMVRLTSSRRPNIIATLTTTTMICTDQIFTPSMWIESEKGMKESAL